MQTHPGYFIDSLSNQPWYRCCSCQYDTFSRDSAQTHARFAHRPVVLPKTVPNRLFGKTVGVALLTWNTKTASEYAIRAILRELRILSGLGVRPRLFWADNGSDDGTADSLNRIIHTEYGCPDAITLHQDNLGQSAGRNETLQNALAFDCDHLVMVDGDIEVVPQSVYSLANYLEGQPETVGCAGIYCRNCTADPQDEVLPELPALEPWMFDLQPGIAWTNYGVFRRSVLEQCRFDTSEAFTGPGWGFEDDDYYLAMLSAGFHSVNTKYVRHLHRKRHSSLRLLDPALVTKVYNQRRAYVANKWRNSPLPEVRFIANRIENQTLPVIE